MPTFETLSQNDKKNFKLKSLFSGGKEISHFKPKKKKTENRKAQKFIFTYLFI